MFEVSKVRKTRKNGHFQTFCMGSYASGIFEHFHVSLVDYSLVYFRNDYVIQTNSVPPEMPLEHEYFCMSISENQLLIETNAFILARV